MSDWKEIEDTNAPCGSENGWCGMCGRCTEHWNDLQERDKWSEQEELYGQLGG